MIRPPVADKAEKSARDSLTEKLQGRATEWLDQLGDQESGFSTFSLIRTRSAKNELLSNFPELGRQFWNQLLSGQTGLGNKISIVCQKGLLWDESVRWATEQVLWVGEQDSVWLFPQRLQFALFPAKSYSIHSTYFFWIGSVAALLMEGPARKGQKTF